MIRNQGRGFGCNGQWRLLLIITFAFAILAGCASQGEKNVDPISPTTASGAKKRTVDVDEAVKARVAAGVGYLEAGDFDRAHHHLNRALELNDESSKVHSALALLYRFEGDAKKEEAHYKTALELDSENSQAHHNYGTFLCGQGRFKDAEYHFKQAAKDYRYIRRGHSYENMGRCYLKQGAVDKAKSALENAYRLDPKSPWTLLELGVISYEQGNNDRAYELFKEYEKIAKHNSKSLWLGIRLERIFGNLDALASYELALRKLYPGSTEFANYKESLQP